MSQKLTLRTKNTFRNAVLWILGAFVCSGSLQSYLPVTVHADGWHSPPFISSPLKYWRRNKERLGYPPDSSYSESEAAEDLPEIDDLDAAKEKYDALVKAYGAEKNSLKKKERFKELARWKEAIDSYLGKTQAKRPANIRQRMFIHKIVTGMAYINSDNLALNEFGWILQNRKRVMNEFVQILKEIGPDAVPQVWEHLRTEIVLHGSGKRVKNTAAQDIKRTEKKILEIIAKMKRVRDKPTWEALQGHLNKLQKERQEFIDKKSGKAKKGDENKNGAPLDGLRNSGFKKLGVSQYLPKLRNGGTLSDVTGVFLVSKDYIENLSRAIVAIGLPGLEGWMKGLWDLNPGVRAHARTMLDLLGMDSVPILVDKLENQEDKNIKKGVIAALEQLTGKTFGDETILWRNWWKKSRPMVVKKNAGKIGIPDAPPGAKKVITPLRPNKKTPPKKKEDDEFDDFQIGAND